MTLHKEYHVIDRAYNNPEKQTIKFAVSYWKGTGYRVTAVPVKISDHTDGKGNGYQMETVGAYTGFNDTLLQASRQSAKSLKEAITILESRKEKYLAYFITVNQANADPEPKRT